MYRLYIPSLLNKEVADRMINKLLRGLNIISSHVKENGKWKNALSLGISYNRKNALEELEKSGIINLLSEDLSVTLKKLLLITPFKFSKSKCKN